MAEPENISFTHDNVTTNAIAVGTGAPVVLVHGFAQSLRTWVLNIDAIAARYRTLAMDLPGCGGSTKIPMSSLEMYTDNLVRLLDTQGLESAHIVGHSFGGLVALGLALEHPGRVRTLSLLSTAGFGPTTTNFRKNMAHASTPDDIRDAIFSAFHNPMKFNDPIEMAVQGQLAYRAEPGVMEQLAELNQISEAWITSTTSRIEEIKVPMLVMWGKEDQATPATHVERVRELSNVEVHLFDNAGHAAHMEAAQAFNETLLRFLDGLPPG